ncbi:MAG: hypothetical protein LUC83_05290, partial [Clostridiales bacterium]|nr:hypothetical protein [Clostridiales bacterium]
MGKSVKQGKKKKIFLPMIIVIVLAAVILIVIFASGGGSSSDSDSLSGEETQENESKESVEADDDIGGSADNGESDDEEDSSMDNLIQGFISSQDETDIAGNSGDGIAFPYTSDIDQLELIAVYNYSGYYIEDGTEDEIDSVVVLEVKNMSDQAIEYAEITLTADG